MTNTSGVDVSKIEVGDRVGIRSSDFDDNFEHWGVVIGFRETINIHVRMDEPELPGAQGFGGYDDIEPCFFAVRHEITSHIPAAKVAMHEGRPTNVEDHGQPNPLAKVIADLTETHRYLQQVTGKTFEAAIQGFELEVSGDYNSHSVTLRFVEKGK